LSTFVSDGCPIPDTHDKFNEAHYYLGQMLTNYHDPDRFRFSLNSFLQSLRNVTFALQKELTEKDGFSNWYKDEQTFMESDRLLKKFVEGRNIVVKQGNLRLNSSVEMGLFRDRKLKLGFNFSVPIFVHSAQLLEEYKDKIIGTFIDEEHSAIGEQMGVKRKWIANELGDAEVVELCDSAWARIGKVVSNAHKFCKSTFDPPKEHDHDIPRASVLLESDVDSSLLEKWGWLD